jgi:hypothetical protein
MDIYLALAAQRFISHQEVLNQQWTFSYLYVMISIMYAKAFIKGEEFYDCINANNRCAIKRYTHKQKS